ncbi:MAG: hypothetical protein KF871_15775 [Hydrogenophaga sp.]|uniref:hypothetical protein n=1 Tax=Hydrogenophaga sp. TaxID=1904254 RepID=UPI001DF9F37D|nr:hypothetical protein [Hydrogenophaga sp.]MBX3611352.1 hypothetical protein [Hydrogenophaga sp.]
MNRCATPAIVLMALALAGCETAPRSGALTAAQVLDVPASPHAVRDGHPELFAALRAGVTRREMEEERLVQGECGTPDTSDVGGTRWTTVTTVLPAGTRLAPGTEVVVVEARSAWPRADATSPERLHGRFVRALPAPPASGQTRCHTPDDPVDTWRLRIRSPLPAWSFDFAQAALQRIAAFNEDDFAQSRVVRVGCQLKVLDGGDWYVPVWLARAPAGLALARGDQVRLRAGATSNSKDTGPQAEIVAVAEPSQTVIGSTLVRCD